MFKIIERMMSIRNTKDVFELVMIMMIVIIKIECVMKHIRKSKGKERSEKTFNERS